ncbi:hypothetical protein [Rhodopirellula sallentina]|uniref:Secreted protein n=1 Tax=Rhodopirellula sallentina SM41 TaxID=1263870 RepID=M5U4S0_9BACT|nr:hypothetical protein [Rhodopirellula sallentina]EMI56457.1 secreted protein [Rhodopirellula sallentina SM41]
MRNLTIGALIIIGGTVAALPFRRASTDEASTDGDSVLATGPSDGLTASDESVPFEQLWVAPEQPYAAAPYQNSPTRSTPGAPSSLASQVRSADVPQGIPSNAVARPRRDLTIPLTYDDLAVPLHTPLYEDGRYDALATHQQSGRPARGPTTSSPSTAAPSTAAPSTATRTTGIASNSRSAQTANGLPSRFESMRISMDSDDNAARPRAPWEMSNDLPQSILTDSADPRSLARRPDQAFPSDRNASADGNLSASFDAAPPTSFGFQSPAGSSPQPERRSLPANQPARSGDVRGQLASDPHARQASAPQPDQSARPRHWIRQPQ